MSDRYRVLVVGAGKRGMHHAAAFQANGRFDVVGMAGGPDEVRAQVQELREAGLDGIIVNLPDAYDLDTVALAGQTLSDYY